MTINNSPLSGWLDSAVAACGALPASAGFGAGRRLVTVAHCSQRATSGHDMGHAISCASRLGRFDPVRLREGGEP